MSAMTRRKEILKIISRQNTPTSATSLAKHFGVSRQSIVGDIALLRAEGHEITATAHGYSVPKLPDENQYIGKIVCNHIPDDTIAELYSIVDLGAVILNVIIEHELYGELTGVLNMATRRDIDLFMSEIRAGEMKLLSELTNGIHIHTIACRDKSHFEQIRDALEADGYLFQN
ncbi:MAG: transcription repressor NadR [Lachnospiraceae bacterium]|nr:transcription repressor NadR [Lachnospiraceae bacterium]